MPKLILALLVLLANVFVVISQDSPPADTVPMPHARPQKNKPVLKSSNLYNECRTITGARKLAVKSFIYSKVPIRKEGKCFVQCILDRYAQLHKSHQKHVDAFLMKSQFKRRFKNLKCKDVQKPQQSGKSTRATTKTTTETPTTDTSTTETSTTENYDSEDVHGVGQSNGSLDDIFGEENKGVVLPKINIRYDHSGEEDYSALTTTDGNWLESQPCNASVEQSAEQPNSSKSLEEQHSEETYETYEVQK